MGRTTVTDVREVVDSLNSGWTEPEELTFSCWGVGTNKYQLMDAETGKTYGPVCNGASEFMALLRGFEAGRRL
jgi:hypothetical protein